MDSSATATGPTGDLIDDFDEALRHAERGMFLLG